MSIRHYWVIQLWYYAVFLIDKILKVKKTLTGTNWSLFWFFSISAVHNKERNIIAKVAEDNSLSLGCNSINMEHNKEQNQCSYDFNKSH